MDTIFSNITLIFKSRLRRTNLCRRLFHFCAWCCYYFLRHQINLLSGLSWGEPLPLYWPSNLQKKPMTGYYSYIITFITICILSIGYHISAVCAVDAVLQLYMSTPGLNPWCWHWIIKMGAKWSKHPGKWVNILLYTLFFRTYRNEILGSFIIEPILSPASLWPNCLIVFLFPRINKCTYCGHQGKCYLNKTVKF